VDFLFTGSKNPLYFTRRFEPHSKAPQPLPEGYIVRRNIMCKELTLLSCLLIVLCASANSAGATLVAHWRLDNDATDSVGGIDGTLMNGPQFTTDAMEGSHALALDGAASQYVDFGNPPGLPAGRSPRSLAAWGRTDTIAGGWRWIAAYGNAATSQAMFIGINGTSLYGGGYGDDVPLTNFWEVGVWHHICLTYDGSVARLYADGVELDSQTKSWNLTLNRAHIGRQVNDAAEFWDGLVDDVRIYDGALSPVEIKKLAGISEATSPDPPDGAIHTETWINLRWVPGGYAVSHDVYLADNFDEVNDGTGEAFRGNQTAPNLLAGFIGFAYPDGLVPGTTYYWRVDEVNDANPDSPWRGPVWSFLIPSREAYNPIPEDGAKFILPDATLSWTAGHEAKLHTIYFGDDYDAVANATNGVQSTDATYSPGELERGKTYYWRVDEFDAFATHKGDVWSFTTLRDIPIGDPDLVAWWKLDEGGGTTVVDWSGHGNHGTLNGDPEWTDGIDAGALDLDGTGDYVNFASTSDLPSGTSARTLCGWGKTNTVASGWQWIAAYGTAGTSQAMFIGLNGTDLYGGGYGDDVPLNGLSGFWEVDVWHHICLTYDGTTAILYADGIQVASEAKTWDLPLSRAHIGRQVNDLAEFWNGLVDDIRIYSRALTPDEINQVMRGDTTRAWDPSPANNAISDVFSAASVSWSVGDSASQHAVYFARDRDAVANAEASDTTGVFRVLQTTTNYTPPEGIEWNGGSYYWRIDEHNTDGTITRGNIWSFSIPDYVTVDDFESYNEIPDGEIGSNLVYLTWIDGYENQSVNGSNMGYLVGASLETGNVHGGNKSVPFQFNNNPAGISEVVRTFASAQDWTAHGIITLSLWFAGNAANVPGQLYVKVNGVQVNYDGDVSNLKRGPWQVWNIDLTKISTNLSRVTSLAVGIQGPGANGTLLLDDIRLYAKPRELVTPVQPGTAGLAAQFNFEGNANDSAGGHHGTVNGGPLYVPGKLGQAIALDGIDDHVVVGSVGISGVQPRTIAGWAKANVIGTPAWVDVFGFTGPSGGNGHFDIELVGDTGTTTLGWYGLHVYGWEQDIMPIDLEWHHLGASYDGTTIKWYGDGLLVGSEDRTLATPDNVHVGKRQDNNNYFPGQVDDFRIYNRVLSDEEMAGLAGITQPYDKPF